MANTVDKVIRTALNEEGYMEKSYSAYKDNPSVLDSKTDGAGFDNYTKYGRDMHKIYPSVMDFPAAWCFTKDSMVLTENGYKSVEDINIGDMVLNAYGNKFNKVISNIPHDDIVAKLRTYGTVDNIGTLDHPILSGKRKDKYHRNKGFKNVGFNPIGKLDKGDVCAISTSTPLNNTLDGVDDDLIWLIGYYVGDGYKNRNLFRVCANDAKLAILQEKNIDIKFDKMYDSRTCYEGTIMVDDNNILYDLLSDCGVGAKHKRVPSSILFSNNKIKSLFLDGYLSADGWNKSKFSTVSKELILGVSKIIFDLGYCCSIREVHRSTEGKIFDKRTNEHRIFHQEPVIYTAQINYNTKKANKHRYDMDEFIGVRVKSVEIVQKIETVYTITTDGDHTYTANNICVHNCDAYCDWCFMQAYGISTAKSLLAGDFDDYTIASSDMYKKHNAWYTSNPQVGDQIFFWNSSKKICHTGLVIGVDSNRVYTIEGNTSSASGVIRNGGGVFRKSYEINHPRIAGYGRPRYDKIDGVGNVNPADIASPTLRRGSLGDEVKKLQSNLNSVIGANLEVDGIFGGGTFRALQEFQNKYGLEVDGIYGRRSEAKMRELIYK